jgi:hypothetical protein
MKENSTNKCGLKNNSFGGGYCSYSLRAPKSLATPLLSYANCFESEPGLRSQSLASNHLRYDTTHHNNINNNSLLQANISTNSRQTQPFITQNPVTKNMFSLLLSHLLAVNNNKYTQLYNLYV